MAATNNNNTGLLIKRARESGRCAPSLMSEDRIVAASEKKDDGFSEGVLKLLDGDGTCFFVAFSGRAGWK